jgi:uncharacterized membrane protein YqaE (UPF0057 family)
MCACIQVVAVTAEVGLGEVVHVNMCVCVCVYIHTYIYTYIYMYGCILVVAVPEE